MDQDSEARRGVWDRQARRFETKVHFNRTCGIEILQWDDTQVVIRLPHAEWLCNNTDGFHGGVIASLADSCGTAASLAATGDQSVIATISMSISYLAVATTDITATGTCIKAGTRVQVSEVRLRDAAERLVAEAIVTTTRPG